MAGIRRIGILAAAAVLAGVFLARKTLQAVFRFDAYDENLSAGGDRSDVRTAGFNAFFGPRTKLQIDYELWRSEAGATVDRIVFVQFQIGY